MYYIHMSKEYMDAKTSFKMNLKRLRALRNLSQTDLAKALDLSKQALSNLENGDGWPSHQTVAKLAKALKCEETDLFKDPEEDKRTNDRIEKAKKLLNQI